MRGDSAPAYAYSAAMDGDIAPAYAYIASMYVDGVAASAYCAAMHGDIAPMSACWATTSGDPAAKIAHIVRCLQTIVAGGQCARIPHRVAIFAAQIAIVTNVGPRASVLKAGLPGPACSARSMTAQ